jgi:hypothetical protein
LSATVQVELSLHDPPLFDGTLTQEPPEHAPALHWSPAPEQSFAVPLHTPPAHASFNVQASPSLHTVPAGLTFLVQEPNSHAPMLHKSVKLLQSFVVPVHWPA